MAGQFPLLSEIASDAIGVPVTSVDVERSLSQYKYLLKERRESLTDENTRRLMILYYNGDIEQRFKGGETPPTHLIYRGCYGRFLQDYSTWWHLKTTMMSNV